MSEIRTPSVIQQLFDFAESFAERHSEDDSEIDLSEYLKPEEFNQTLRALERAVQGSKELRLDKDGDRVELIRRLWASIGAVVARSDFQGGGHEG